MIENHISDYFYNELFCEINEEKGTAFQSIDCSQKYCKTAQLLSKHFPSGLSLCIIYFLFHKDKDISAIPQPSVYYLIYVFSISFVFIDALITST